MQTAADAGQDAGGDTSIPTGPCTGGCGPSQVCDVTRHACVDGCGGCDAGVCIKNQSGQFECVAESTSCNNTVCLAGQAFCAAGHCSCMGFTRIAQDSCTEQGRVCRAEFNPVTLNGGTCSTPRRYEACQANGPACAPGYSCQNVFNGGAGSCMKTCASGNVSECGRDEFCDYSNGQGSKLCYPQSFFVSPDCTAPVPVTGPDGGLIADGGTIVVPVPVSNACLLRSVANVATESTPTGTCSYSLFRLPNMFYPVVVCRPPGSAALYASCRQDYAPSALATQCGTGMECALTSGEAGVCLKMCNAAEPLPGFAPTPACGAHESCVNLYRMEDPNAVAGVCMKTCDVFNAADSACADYGATRASCIPTLANGRTLIGATGAGLCVPQQTSVAALGQPCAETDPFKGAACAAGLLCAGDPPTCQAPCDVACAGASPPARCNADASRRCPNGQSCAIVTSTTGAILGLCR